MECPKCHSDNPETLKFCGECGTKLDIAGKTPEAKVASSGLKDQISVTKTLETSTDELIRGTVLAGRYEIIEELGAGGMGRVYRAYDKKIEEEVALKLIRPDIAAEERTAERFRNEIKIARKIRHANIGGMFDLQEEGKNLFITMEYVRGEDLKSVIRRMKVLTAGTAVSIARQVAEGLGEAHRLGVVHRDLKPGNIMIDKEGNAKIMDFGIARSLAAARTTVEGVVIGTPEYMSPEQAESKEVDQRSDIYSLGVILYEMVTGTVPFEGNTPLSIAMKHKLEAPRNPKELVSQLPDSLSFLILKCLEKNREKRYQDAQELCRELEKIEIGTQDIFAIEEEITSAIITALRLELTGEEKKKISERRIDDVRAYEFYLKAKREIGLWTKEGCDQALQYLEKGLEIIGENAMLNAGIGYVYYSYANLGIRGEENGKKAESFANKALEMDPESSEAHLVLGLINSAFFGNQQEGVDHLKQALAANPYDGDILWWLGITYAFTGKISAAEKIAERMSEFDPLNNSNHPPLPGEGRDVHVIAD